MGSTLKNGANIHSNAVIAAGSVIPENAEV